MRTHVKQLRLRGLRHGGWHDGIEAVCALIYGIIDADA